MQCGSCCDGHGLGISPEPIYECSVHGIVKAVVWNPILNEEELRIDIDRSTSVIPGVQTPSNERIDSVESRLVHWLP
jgi:hypothetical protein